MGSKGGSTQTATTTSSLPPDVLANYDKVTNQAFQTAATPYTPYTGQLVAGTTPQQQQGYSGINAAQGVSAPYFNTAQGLIGQGTQGYTPTAFNAANVGQYESPYTQDVINSTMANINQNNAIQQNQLQGNAIASGAWGGDRADLARNDLARQQALASNQTIAGLENQDYSQALGQFNQQNQLGLQTAGLGAQTALQGAGLTGALGNYAQSNALQGAEAQVGAGTQQQTTQQAQDAATYGQFLQQQAYPFQTTSWLSGITSGLGQQGGTSTTTQPSQQSNSVLGFLGLKSGGKVEGYAEGGSTPYSGYINPDFSSSYVPAPNTVGGGQSSIPKAPQINPNKQSQTTLPGLINGGKNLYGIGKSLATFFGPSDITAAPAESDAAMTALSGTSAAGAGAIDLSTMAPEAIDAIGPETLMLAMKSGGKVNGYADGGYTSPPMLPSYIMGDPSMGTFMNQGIGGSLTPNQIFNGQTVNVPNGISGSGVAYPTGFGGSMSTTPYSGFKDSIVPAAPQPQGGQSSIPNAPTISAPQPQGGQSFPVDGEPTIASQASPSAQTDLQAQLAADKPVLDKDQAIWAGIAGAMAGKNRGILQNVGEGLQQGLANYGQQKAAVRDYTLKQSEIDKQVQLMDLESKRWQNQAEVAAQNAKSTQDLKEAVANQVKNGDKTSIENNYADAVRSGEVDKAAAYKAAMDAKKPATATQSSGLQSYFKDPTTADVALESGKITDSDLTPEANAKVNRLLAGGNPSAISKQKDARDELTTLASLKDPSYNENEYATRAAVEKANTGAGKIGQEYTSFNTIMQHGPMAIQQAADLGNQGVWTPGNKLINVLQSNTSDPRVKVLKNTITLLASEKAKMLQGQGVVTDAAREENNMETMDSPEQLKAEVMNTINQTAARANVRQQEYINDLNGSESDFVKKRADSFIQPASRNQLNKLGIPVNNFYGENKSTPAVAPKFTPGQTANGPNGPIIYDAVKGWIPNKT